jgi:hypothetical protein
MAASETIPSRGKLFGIPVSDIGLFPCVFMGVAFGVICFFATCFVTILALLFYNKLGHHAIDLADAYRFVALPVGVVALLVGVMVMITVWMRGRMSRS